jgi:hypothetical protein
MGFPYLIRRVFYMQIELATLTLPEFGLPQTEPTIAADTYKARIEHATGRFMAAGYDVLIVYGDREHAANIAYLTGYDPRFEEALLILTPEALPTLLIGNEGMGYAELISIELHRVLYQSFSLPGQPRGESASLKDILQAAGVAEGQRVGVVGWKYFDERESANYQHWLEVPSFIVETLTEIVRNRANLFNATELFMHPKDGLRAVNEVEQLAVFEFAATHTSQGLRNVLFGVQAGMTEYDAVRLMQISGIPLACHLMLSSGRRAALGLPSPSIKVMETGEPVTMAYGAWGALNARAGFLVRDESELAEDIRDYVDKLVVPYFRAIVAWYETIGIGIKGGDLFAVIHEHIGDPFFGVGLNPGHLIHIDEWVNSPIYFDSPLELQSGMALQVDVIPATHSPYHTTNIEDGIALADEGMRQQFAAQYPEAWGRIQQRRQYMLDVLGIKLKPEVLPFSNIPAYLPPFWLAPQKAMRVRN